MSRGVKGGHILPVVLTNTAGAFVNVETESKSLVVMDVVHWRIHQGQMFLASYKSPDASPIADDASISMLLVTDGGEPHLVFDVEAGGDCEIQFYEDTTTSNDGTALAEVQMNRNSAKVATLTATHTPTVSGAGTLLMTQFQPGGIAGQSTGGGGFSPREWILKGSTKYLIIATNRAGTAQPMSISAQWYEEGL